jgi:hypothetical protein
MKFPRIGAFEVLFRDEYIFSKLRGGLWPHPGLITDRITAVIDGRESTLRASPQRPKQLDRYPTKSAASLTLKPSTSLTKTKATTGSRTLLPKAALSIQKKAPFLSSDEDRPEDSFESPPDITQDYDDEFEAEDRADDQSNDEDNKTLRVEGTSKILAKEESKSEPPVHQSKAPVAGYKSSYAAEEHKTSPDEPYDHSEAYSSDADKSSEGSDDRGKPEDAVKGNDEHAKAADKDSSEESNVSSDQPKVTKSYSIKISLCQLSHKRIPYKNEENEDEEYELRSSDPDLMDVKEAVVHVPAGGNGKFKLTFAPVTEEAEKRYFLYVMSGGEVKECIEILVSYKAV